VSTGRRPHVVIGDGVQVSAAGCGGSLPCTGSPMIKDFLIFVLVSSVILLKRGDTALAQPTAPPQSL
jgi:hypothetical protein